MSAIEERHLQALRALAEHRVAFVLIGGVALQAHGYSGATKDVDVTVAVGAENEQRVDAALRALGAHSPTPGKWGTSFQTPLGKVELLRDSSGVGDYDAWVPAARTMQLANGVTVQVGSPSMCCCRRRQPTATRIARRCRRSAPSCSSWAPWTPTTCAVWSPSRVRSGPTSSAWPWTALERNRPDDGQLADVWDFSARRVAQFRARWQISTGPEEPLGTAPTDAEQGADRDRLESSLQRSARILERGRGREEPGLER